MQIFTADELNYFRDSSYTRFISLKSHI